MSHTPKLQGSPGGSHALAAARSSLWYPLGKYTYFMICLKRGLQSFASRRAGRWVGRGPKERNRVLVLPQMGKVCPFTPKEAEAICFPVTGSLRSPFIFSDLSRPFQALLSDSFQIQGSQTSLEGNYHSQIVCSRAEKHAKRCPPPALEYKSCLNKTVQ